jgi:hypothetical protein
MTAVFQADSGNTRVRKERERGRATSQRTHGSARTTPRVRRKIQESEEKNTVLAKRINVSRNTIAKWRARESTSDERMGPKYPRSKVLTLNDEALVLAYHWRTRLTLDDSLVRLKRLIPKLTRSALYRCLKRNGLNNIGWADVRPPPLKSAGLAGSYFFEITANEVAIPDGPFGLAYAVFLAVEENTKEVYAEFAEFTPENAATFLTHLVAECPPKIFAVATDISPIFTAANAMFGEYIATVGPHPFAVVCRANRIDHAARIPRYPKPSKPKKGARTAEIR